ncbi:hypothetical protein INT45_000347, partial [Circinella minor]
ESADMNPAINDRNAAENADEPDCPPGSVIDQYSSSIRSKFKKRKQPKEYDTGTYWVTPNMPSFALENVVLDPKSYIILVSVFTYGTLIILWRLKTCTVLTTNTRLK